MRIKRVRIDHYGPLSGIQERHFSGFTLVYGSNERGKTLFIDAILRLLFK